MPEPDNRYPEPGEFIIGTVNSIFKQGSFIDLDEYPGKRGMLPLSEISLKWVRNIRDYVREGQKVVLIVLGVNPERGHIDLSLRRVTDAKRKDKLQQVKQKQRAEKFFEILARDLNVTPEEMEQKLKSRLMQDFSTLYEGLEAIASDETIADNLGLDAKWKTAFVELVKKSIKPAFVYITGYVQFRSYEPNGVIIIKEALKKIECHKGDPDSKIELAYISPPIYRIKIRSMDYKNAEKTLKGAADEGIAHMHKHSSIAEFYRKQEEIRLEN